MNYPLVPLASVVSLQRGIDLPGPTRRPGPYPVVSAGGVVGSHDEAPVKGPGVAIGRATNLGQPTWVEGDYWPLNTTLFVRDFKGNDPRFVYRLFQSIDLTGFDSGSVQAMLNRNYIAQVPVQLPPLHTQRAIAEVLGALDDKIAANSQLSASAVELADFEFQAAKRRQPLTSTTFDAVCTAAGGGTPSTKVPEFWDGDIPWVTPTDVTALSSPYLDRTSRQITEAGLAKCSSALYPVESILMTSRATIGAFALAKTPVAVNQGFIVAHSRNQAAQLWLFHEMRSRVEDFLAHANGATFLELSKSRFRAIEVQWPSDDAAFGDFSGRVAPLHHRAHAASKESRQLADLRDTLLPHLMSGRITVREAEKQVEEAL